MARIAMVVTAGLLAGGFLLAPGEARACEAHAKQAAAAKGTEARPPEAGTASQDASEGTVSERPLDALDRLLTAKCSCGSKADCTCKKGQCQCSKCNGRHEPRQVMDALRGRQAEQKLQDARYDASAGIFI